MSATHGMHAQKPILIAGPTASGKSALALALARRLGGCIINADSMQVYRELSILTARPPAGEEAEVPHRLYGHVPAQEAYSVGRYADEAARTIAEVQALGLRPIIAGGTGLYFKALLEGLSPIPPISDSVRTHWRSEGARLAAEEMHGVLQQRDPVMATRLDASDTQRIVRALEVLEETGRSLAFWQEQPGTPVVPPDAIKLRVERPRAELHARADARFDAMMQAGALDEAARLAQLQLSADLPAMRALGVGPLIAAVRGDLPVAEAVARAKAETRQYIKRQETWARRYMISWMATNAQLMERIAANGLPFIDL